MNVDKPDQWMRQLGAYDELIEAALEMEELGGCGNKIGPYRCCTVVEGDCLELIKELPTKAIDAVITDPPYGIAYDASHSKYKNGIDRGVAEWDKKPYDPAPIIALGLPTIMWGGNCFSSRLPDATSWISWVKILRQDADIRQSDCELAWTNCLGRSRVFHHLWIGAYRESESGIRNSHPCQKPEVLMRWCIDLLPKAKIILDPYSGSGTTLVAAKQLGRHFLGFEILPKYCEIARMRLTEIDQQPSLFPTVQAQPEQLALDLG